MTHTKKIRIANLQHNVPVAKKKIEMIALAALGSLKVEKFGQFNIYFVNNKEITRINRKYLKSYYLRIMPGLGHFPMLEAPDEFNRQLEDIVREIKKTSCKL